VRAGRLGLGEEDGAREENDADEEEEDEQSELAHARLDRLAEDLQALGVARQLEDPEHPDQSDDTEDRQRHGLHATSPEHILTAASSIIREFSFSLKMCL